MKVFQNSFAAGLVASVVFIASGVLGWRLTGRVPASDEPAPVATRSTLRSRFPGHVDQIRRSDNLVERMRRTIILAHSIPLTEIDNWLEGSRFDPGDGYEKTMFTRILRDRQINEGAVEPVDQTPVARLERFLKMAACGLPEGETPAHSEGLEVFALMAKEDPATLEAALDKLMIPYRTYAEEALRSRRLSESFDEEIRKLWDRPNGWRLFRPFSGNPEYLAKLFAHGEELPPSWLRAMAGKDVSRISPPAVAEFWWNTDLEAAGFTEEQTRRIRKEALRGIARTDQAKALGLMDEANLDPAERKKFIQLDIFARASLGDAQAAKLLHMLEYDEDWQAAQEQLARKRGVTYRRIPHIDDPGQWLTGLGEYDLKSDEWRQYQMMLGKWNNDQVKRLAEQFQSMPDATQTEISEKLVGAWKARKHGHRPEIYGEAIRHLAADPAKYPEIIRTATWFALRWARKDSVAAADWVLNLPAGEARSAAQKNLAVQWSELDPAAASRWLKSLPENERSQVRDFLEGDSER